MVTPPSDRRELVDASDRATWRAWLAEHHAEAAGAWLVFSKKGSGRPGITYDEAVEEALCFGWIDSRLNQLDGEQYVLRFTPRKGGACGRSRTRSGWSVWRRKASWPRRAGR